jgi:pre-mRNA-splicing factor 38A
MNDDYTKEQLFALNAESLIDRAFELKYVGGTYGKGITRPSKFICLLLKMLQM